MYRRSLTCQTPHYCASHGCVCVDPPVTREDVRLAGIAARSAGDDTLADLAELAARDDSRYRAHAWREVVRAVVAERAILAPADASAGGD